MREIKFRFVWERPKTWHGPYRPDDVKYKYTFRTLEEFIGVNCKPLRPDLQYVTLIDRQEYIGCEDKNDVEIYEGDLYEEKGCMYPIEVYYDERYAEFRGRVNGEMQSDKTRSLRWHNSWEVIGNIYKEVK